ncbi:hypothetical protein ACFV8E_07325 [Streptomyces sp. NPDC059849]|uniref:AAA family ATPase n=2 Tax=Streptomyces TaxID=1883 RepID=UPI00365C3A1E
MMPPTTIRVNSTSASGARAEGLPVTLKLLTWPDDLSAPAVPFDAVLHYLARMPVSGEDRRFIARRLVVHASEDVGLADPTALQAAVAAACRRSSSSACPRHASPWRRPPCTWPWRRSRTR